MALKRSPINPKRATPRRNVKPTPKGELFQREFEKMKPICRERSQGVCEAPKIVSASSDSVAIMAYATGVECAGHATHVHHRRYRTRGGTNALVNLLHVCEPCHSWIHANGGAERPANILRLALLVGESEEL